MTDDPVGVHYGTSLPTALGNLACHEVPAVDPLKETTFGDFEPQRHAPSLSPEIGAGSLVGSAVSGRW